MRAASWLDFQVTRICVHSKPSHQRGASEQFCFVLSEMLQYWGFPRFVILGMFRTAIWAPKQKNTAHIMPTWQLFTSIKRSNFLHVLIKVTKLQESSPANTGQNPKALCYKHSYNRPTLMHIHEDSKHKSIFFYLHPIKLGRIDKCNYFRSQCNKCSSL